MPDKIRLMVVSRLAAFGLAATMLNLNLARADVSCAAHRGHAAVAAQPHTQGVGHSDGAPIDTRCDTPGQPDCCAALTSCTVLLGTNDGAQLAVSPDARLRVVVAVASAPSSRITAPEPPPPRR